MKINISQLLLIVFLLSSYSVEATDILAFPTAEGYGKYTKGGRGGEVIEVTNLNDSGSGSLRAAINAKYPRTIVFKVSGTIDLKSPLRITHPYITIAGQTAPGDGICIKRFPLNIAADEVIIRYIRVRLGDEAGQSADAISCRYHKNIILDHVSASWSVDETISIYHCENVTVQWCIIAESLSRSVHTKGQHGFGAIWGSNYSTYHHNLFAHHSSRNPRWASGAGYNDYRNNVIYNWGYNSSYGGEKHQLNNPRYSEIVVNFVNNYYKPGPATRKGTISYRILNPGSRGKDDYGKWYVSGNVIEGNPKVSRNNWDGGVQVKGGIEELAKYRMYKPWPAMRIKEHSPQKAYKQVLANAGCVLPKRDAIDARIIKDVRLGIATYGSKSAPAKGIIDSQNDVGGWCELGSNHAPIDTDRDGMPDNWEIKEGLNPNNAADGKAISKNKYTNLENYLNKDEIR